MGQGRMVLAKDAVALGMADRVATIQQVLHRMGADEGGTSPGAAMARARAVEIECNLPTLFAFVHNSKTADKEPIWGAVDKTKLPRIAFAEKGEPDKKSTWGYPHHWVSGAGNPDDNGVWTTGTLFLHREGLNAAWAAANGARSGQKADQAVIDHLQAHRRALGLEKE